ncbi:hotdog fold domain-containing protein [Simiduia agarivorans]|uniref:DUF4442 domain-containing protein n=1 Tax=Simiduia agarivorans (strain DSM 21679 / JCM 13881 / BCRC 17597 / SA1) TaxID=1117647 RepID=K4KX66_SIMAS|nr:hotdog fold domain-containing protein [Simiduia agarivorans]AFU98532.1 hypothetical protein M5M_06685 [Simiduia agarivorans SA1 = DSM 21679]
MNTLHIWQTCQRYPLGSWLFSRLFCLKAPYFGSIRPRFVQLAPELCEVHLKKRRAVHNHIGTVHAIAICNLAEAAAGTMTDATVPKSHRWIPKGMTVEYQKKAGTDLKAIARPMNGAKADEPGDYPVEVLVTDTNGDQVFRAVISMWISERPAA